MVNFFLIFFFFSIELSLQTFQSHRKLALPKHANFTQTKDSVLFSVVLFKEGKSAHSARFHKFGAETLCKAFLLNFINNGGWAKKPSRIPDL